MTTTELTELQATVARLYEIADWWVPPHMRPELTALWADLTALIGVEAEAVAMAAARECQSEMFAALWGPV